MVIPDVDSYTKTLNHQIILLKPPRNLLQTKQMLKLKYKLSGGPSSTSVTCKRGQFAPPAAAGRVDQDTVRISFARNGKKLARPSVDKQFSGVPTKIFLSLLHSVGIQLIPVEFCLRPHWLYKVAGAPLCHSAPPLTLTFISGCSE